VKYASCITPSIPEYGRQEIVNDAGRAGEDHFCTETRCGDRTLLSLLQNRPNNPASGSRRPYRAEGQFPAGDASSGWSPKVSFKLALALSMERIKHTTSIEPTA
jgi:hypothetical protein